MPKYKKKPIIVDALQYNGLNFAYVIKWSAAFCDQNSEVKMYKNTYGEFIIKTLEGKMIANEGDFIIHGISGYFYPCKQDIFKKTYTLVREE